MSWTVTKEACLANAYYALVGLAGTKSSDVVNCSSRHAMAWIELARELKEPLVFKEPPCVCQNQKMVGQQCPKHTPELFL